MLKLLSTNFEFNFKNLNNLPIFKLSIFSVLEGSSFDAKKIEEIYFEEC